MIKLFHSGGVTKSSGLRADEVPIIAKAGSETLMPDKTGLPHILICIREAVAIGERPFPRDHQRKVLLRHKMLRVVCPWDGRKPLLVGDIAILGKGGRDKAATELNRIRALGVHGKLITWTALMAKPKRVKRPRRA